MGRSLNYPKKTEYIAFSNGWYARKMNAAFLMQQMGIVAPE